MNRSIAVILATVALTATGIGLTMPVIPQLLREVGHTGDLGWRYGAFLALYALIQFVFAPLLGALSDRFGRRPLLLMSLAGAAVDYLFMTVAPTLWLLFVGRAIAGITGAVSAVASAYIADVTPEDQRARRFGQLGAAFGIGFIAGPAIGGLLGGLWTRAPFLVAAALNGITLLIALFVLKEPERRNRETAAVSLNPFAPLRWAFGFPLLLPLLGTAVLLTMIGEVGGTIWVVYVEDKFAWDPLTVGISLALFGLFHALAQAFVAGPVSERLGEKKALFVSIAADSTAYVLIGLATRGWMAFVLLPLLCLGGIGAPALQSLMTSEVDENNQGRLQGVLAGLTSLASVVAPLAISTGYFATRATFPGLVWIGAAALYFLCVPLLVSRRRLQSAPARP